MQRFKQTEGLVLYYLIKDKTIGLTKVKTIWYIIVRAIREKIKCSVSNKKKKPLSDRINDIKTRLDEIQKWLGFCNKCLDKWKVCSFLFIFFSYNTTMLLFKNVILYHRHHHHHHIIIFFFISLYNRTWEKPFLIGYRKK